MKAVQVTQFGDPTVLTVVDLLPFAAAATAHERMENRALNGRIVLSPE
jgi:NADPH:quinone reductase-like Zn-dependent oxidoreductase